MNIRKSAAAAALALAAAAFAITAVEAVAVPHADSHDAGISLSMHGDTNGEGGSSRP